jgi:uncharacterized membrane protein YqhA
MKRILASSRYFFIIAVICSFILSVTLFLQSALLTFQLVVRPIYDPAFEMETAKEFAVGAIEVIDFFLLATVFYIVALGLYSLFIDDDLPMPAWLKIHDFDDVKGNLIGVIVVALGVFFLGQVVIWKEGTDLFFFGAGIALVIMALSYFVSLKKKKGTTDVSENAEEQGELRS